MRSVKPVKLMSRTALLGAALAATVAVTGCSAGQVTATDTQVPPITGTNANLVDADNDINVGLRDITVEFSSAGYSEGSAAPLAVRIFNSSTSAPVELTGVESADAEAVTLVDAPSQEEDTEPTEEPGDEEEEPADEEGNGTAEPGDETATDEESPEDETATDEETDQQQGSAEIAQEIAPTDMLLLTTQHEQYLQVEGLSRDINPGDHITVTFLFGDHGRVEMTVPMAMPADAESREHAEFDDDEGH